MENLYVVINLSTRDVLSPEMTLMEALGYMQALKDFGHGWEDNIAARPVEKPKEVTGL